MNRQIMQYFTGLGRESKEIKLNKAVAYHVWKQ